MKNMRQVIKTNQNFVTGEHYEQRVLKPVQAARNRVTVQLCDAASGKLIEEAITENAVSSVLESYAYGKIAAVLNYGEMLNYIADLRPECLILSNSAEAELSDNYFILGDVVGLCNRSDTSGSASSTIKGVYNSAESYYKVEDNGLRHVHVVYDWPTSAGNGKIQTISWLAKQINDMSRMPLACSSIIGEYGSSTSDWRYGEVVYDRHGGAYLPNNGKYYAILNQLKYFNKIEKAKLATSESFYKLHEVSGAYYTATCEFTNSGKPTFTQVMKITKYDYAGNVLDTWSEDLITPIPQLVELRNASKLGSYYSNNPDASFRAYCDYDGWIGVDVYYTSQNAQNVFPVRNSAGEMIANQTCDRRCYTLYNVLTKQWLRLPSPWDAWPSYEQYTNCYVYKKLIDKHFIRQSGSYSAYLLKITNDDVEATSYWGNLGTFNSNDVYCPTTGMHSDLPIYTGYNGSYYSVFALRPIIAQTRLASPITKTSLNTMKIQYDFFFKIPLPYMTPDHVWDLYK